MGQAWRNWAGNQTAEPTAVHHPASVDELAALLAQATATGRGVRPVGSGHSFTAIAAPRTEQLVLDRLDGLVALDRESGLVTVQAGMPLHRLNRLLADQGLALPNLGDIEQQTVSGAISTSTHGTGAGWQGIAAAVRGLDLVTPDGSVLTCSPDQHADVYDLGRVGLGALGVLATVTLQTVPLFALAAHEYPADLDEVLAGWDEIADGTDHAEFYWFPHTRRTLVKRNTRVGLDAVRPLGRVRAWWEDEFLSNTVFGAMVAAGSRVPALVRPFAKVSGHALGERRFTDVSHRVFTSERDVRFVEMEYAVPREHLLPMLREVVAAVEASSWRIAVPVEVRVTGPDDVPLSTASGRATGYLAVHTAPDSPDRAPYFACVERLARQVGGRPHWGKLHTLGADDLAAVYPRFADFTALRDRLDPTGVLANEYLNRVLGVAPGR